MSGIERLMSKFVYYTDAYLGIFFVIRAKRYAEGIDVDSLVERFIIEYYRGC